MTAPKAPRTAPRGTTSTTLAAALVTEVDSLRERVAAHERVLSPAFAPPREDARVSSIGPGEHRPEPFVMRQASTNASPFESDIEHAPGYMEAIRNGTPLTELRRRSAQNAVSRAIMREPDPILHESPVWCGRFYSWGQCRPASPCPACQGHRTVVRDTSGREAPRQVSTVHRDWESFPDHGGTPAHAPLTPPGPEPEWAERAGDFAQARAQAARGPGRAMGTVAQVPGAGGES